MPLEPFGDFLAAVAHLAERDAGPNGRPRGIPRRLLEAGEIRRAVQRQVRCFGHLAGAIRESARALVFTETCVLRHAINRLDSTRGQST